MKKIMVTVVLISLGIIFTSCTNVSDEAQLLDENAQLKEKIAEAHAYAEVYDTLVDPYRMQLKEQTKYGWVGPGQSPDWIKEVKNKAKATGDSELVQRIDYAFSLPFEKEMEKMQAWNKVYVYLAEKTLEVTRP